MDELASMAAKNGLTRPKIRPRHGLQRVSFVDFGGGGWGRGCAGLGAFG
jgi:hypothetical protein